MVDKAKKIKPKRLSKSARIHQRRIKQAARKPGGAATLQMARAQQASQTKSEKATGPTPASPSVKAPTS